MIEGYVIGDEFRCATGLKDQHMVKRIIQRKHGESVEKRVIFQSLILPSVLVHRPLQEPLTQPLRYLLIHDRVDVYV